MFNYNCLLLLSILWFGFINFSDSACPISFVGQKPLFWRKIGNQSIVLPDKTDKYEVQEHESFNIHCEGKIICRSTYNSCDGYKDNLAIKCSDNALFLRTSPDVEWRRFSGHMDLGCANGRISIYESLKSLSNCKNSPSYGIGSRIPGKEQMILLKICFDFLTMHPKYIAYNPRPKALIDVDKITPVSQESFNLDVAVVGLESGYKLANETDYDRAFVEYKSKHLFLRPFAFEYASLVQDELLERELKQYQSMLNVVWWRNLRLGNWKIFMDALQKQTKFQKYEVFMGVNAIAKFPVGNCDDYQDFALQIEQQTISTPEWVWAYVTPLNGKTTEKPFVFVGYNSPFDESVSDGAVCQDICNEVHWLYTGVFNRTHQLKSFGSVHCCRPEEIARIFTDFPFDEFRNSDVTTASSLSK